MTLVRILLGVIGAILKAFTGAFTLLFRSPLALVIVLAVLGAAAFALCSACGIVRLRDRG